MVVEERKVGGQGSGEVEYGEVSECKREVREVRRMEWVGLRRVSQFHFTVSTARESNDYCREEIRKIVPEETIPVRTVNYQRKAYVCRLRSHCNSLRPLPLL